LRIHLSGNAVIIPGQRLKLRENNRLQAFLLADPADALFDTSGTLNLFADPADAQFNTPGTLNSFADPADTLFNTSGTLY